MLGIIGFAIFLMCLSVYSYLTLKYISNKHPSF